MFRSVVLRSALALTLAGSGALANAQVWLVAADTIVRPAAPVAAPPAAPPLQLVSRTRQSPRLEELEFTTPYLEGTTRVRVLTPLGYSTSSGRRWPVLMLLHGCCDTTPFAMGGFSAWTDKGAAERLTRGGKFLVVMPEAGGAGFYTDHFGYAGEGGPRWESYHLRQLLPWVDAHYRTTATRAQRAVAGLSMGGFGTMSYAARHPDLFSLAASWSGAVDPTYGVKGTAVHASTIDQALMGLDARPPQTAFGPWETEEIRTRAHGPVDLVGNLRDTVLTLRTGNGKNNQGVTTDPVEDFVHDQTAHLHDVLARAGIAHTYDDYGTGGHTWDKWQRGLGQLIAPLNAHFARGRGTAPTAFSFTTAESVDGAYGYRFATDRTFLEFTTVSASAHDITVSGSGVLTVTTAPRYVPSARYQLTATRSAKVERTVLTADRSGRLSFAVDTGARSSGQQYRASSMTLIQQVQIAVDRVTR